MQIYHNDEAGLASLYGDVGSVLAVAGEGGLALHSTKLDTGQELGRQGDDPQYCSNKLDETIGVAVMCGVLPVQPHVNYKYHMQADPCTDVKGQSGVTTDTAVSVHVLQRFGGALLQSWLRQMTQSLVSYVYVPFTAALLVGALIAAWVPQPPVLHFANPGLETQYLAWSNTGKLLVDCMFQILFLVVGSCLWLRLENTELQTPEYAAAHASTLLAVISMVCSGMPVLFILLLRSVQYLQWREQLLTGSRLCSVVALALVHLYSSASDLAQLPLGMSFVALTQLMGLACMQVRLATFVPCQVAHLLVLLFKTSVANPSLHFAQLIGGGLCLPCLLLHSLELYSRKAFLATMNNAPKKHKQA